MANREGLPWETEGGNGDMEVRREVGGHRLTSNYTGVRSFGVIRWDIGRQTAGATPFRPSSQNKKSQSQDLHRGRSKIHLDAIF